MENINAVEALVLGWSIIPTQRNKMPMVTGWKQYQTRPPTAEEFARWSNREPAAWAIITGAVSGRFTLDFDGAEGRATLERLQLEPHRQTPSGGFHVDIAHPAGKHVPTWGATVNRELGKRWPGMDVRGDGGYVLFTGHTDKGSYTWLRDPAPHPLERLPADLRQFLGLLEPSAAPEKVDSEKLVRMALDRVGSAGRNQAGFWLATQLRDNSYSQSDAHFILDTYRQQCPTVNRKGDQEEYTEAEMIASLDQAYGHSARAPWGSKAPPAASPRPPGPVLVNGTATAIDTYDKSDSRVYFSLTHSGVYFNPSDPAESNIFVCSPLEVAAYARDPESQSWGRLLRWNDRAGQQHTWIVPMKALVGDGLEFRGALADGGLDFGSHPKAGQLLMQYVRGEKPTQYLTCVPHVGWLDRVFVFPDAVIPADSDVIFQNNSPTEHHYAISGTLEEWRENVSHKCIGNSRLILAMCSAFAGCFLRPLRVQGGGFHFHGFSSTGKSTTQYVAGSVCGGGPETGFVRTWKSTGNALELTAELHNDCILILDELAEIDARDLDTTIYMLANGTGKARGTRTMTSRRTLQWRVMLLSSGEKTIEEHLALADRKLKAGADIRLLSIPADAGANLGLFESIHDAKTPEAFAERLEKSSKQFYGTALRECLRLMTEDWSWIEDGTRFIDAFTSAKKPKDAAPEIRRALRRFAVAAWAGEYATEKGLTGWEPNHATWACEKCFNVWLEARGGIRPLDVEAGIKELRTFLQTQQHRFQAVNPQRIKMKDEERERTLFERVHNRAGYWKIDDNEVFYLLIPDVAHSEIWKQRNYHAILEELHTLGWLVKEGRSWVKRHSVSIVADETEASKERLWFYTIRGKILEG